MRRWCRGQLSATELARGARAGRSNHPDDDDLEKLSRLSEHKSHRDLLRWASRKVTRHPPIYWAWIPLWCSIGMVLKPILIPFLLPHEWIGVLAADDPQSWLDLSTEMEQIVNTWYRRACLPERGPPISGISLWGDTAPYLTGKDSVLLISWRCIAKSLPQRYWVTALNKIALCGCGCEGMHTLHPIYDVLRWSLEACAAGRYPTHDHTGALISQRWTPAKANQELP